MPEAPALRRNQSLQRAVALIRALAAHPHGATQTALAAEVALPVPTARRLLATLADAGIAERDPASGRWLLGYELVRLARDVDPYAGVVARARPALERLVAATGETAMLAAARLPGGVDVIAQIDAPSSLRVAPWVGRRFPLHASVGSRIALCALPGDEVAALLGPGPYAPLGPATLTTPEAVLAELARTRERGVAEGDGELEPGLATVAVPVGEPSARGLSVGLHGPSFRLDAARRRDVLPALRAAAAEIAAATGAPGAG